jgi:hypothetical protein
MLGLACIWRRSVPFRCRSIVENEADMAKDIEPTRSERPARRWEWFDWPDRWFEGMRPWFVGEDRLRIGAGVDR